MHVEASEQGTAIEVEVWEMPESEFGSFVARVPVPLGIGTVTLVNGEAVQGFLCERYAVALAADISHLAVGEPTSNSWRRTDPTTVMIATLAPKGARKDSHSMETSTPNVTSACFLASSTPSHSGVETGLARCSEHFFPGGISLLHSTSFPPVPAASSQWDSLTLETLFCAT